MRSKLMCISLMVYIWSFSLNVTIANAGRIMSSAPMNGSCIYGNQYSAGDVIRELDPGLSYNGTLNLSPDKTKRMISNLNGLDAFPHPENVRVLDLSDNKIQVVPAKIFALFKNLRILYLNSNSISYIDPEAFSGLLKLCMLDLQDNDLDKLDETTFGGLHLNVLHLNINKLTKEGVPSTLFKDLPLTELWIFGNGSPRLNTFNSVEDFEKHYDIPWFTKTQ